MSIINKCTSKYGNPDETGKCKGYLDSEGKMHETCGEPCSYVLMKPGHGDPPFHWRKCLFAGNERISDWKAA